MLARELAEEQAHKKHRGLSKKLEKRREKKRESTRIKKEKRQKREKNQILKEHKNKTTRINEKQSKLSQYIHKLHLYMCSKGEEDDFFEVFKALDKGAEIGLDDIENDTVKKILAKVFKYLGLSKNSNNEYYKGKIETNLEAYAKLISSDDPFQKNSDDEVKRDDELDGEQEDKYEVQINQFDKKEKELTNVAKNEKYASSNYIGPSKEFIQESYKKLSTGVDKEEDDPNDYLSRALNLTTEYESEKRKKIRLGPKRPTPSEALNPQEEAHQQALDSYFKEYDKKHRPKTLLELHQDRKKEGKYPIKDENEEGAFNESVFGQRIESEKVFHIMNDASIHLGKRFSKGKYHGSFM